MHLNIPADPVMGDECTTDYLIIPDGEADMSTNSVSTDRFCGQAFPTSVRCESVTCLFIKLTD